MMYYFNKKLMVALTIGVMGFILAGCITSNNREIISSDKGNSTLVAGKSSKKYYGQTRDEKFKIPPVKIAVPEKFNRQVVTYITKEAPGTIIVEPKENFLYLILGKGKALRYGVGVGAAGLGFEGEAKVKIKRKWPTWRPTDDMIARKPSQYQRYADGVPGGLSNPLGARALYLFQGNIDTYYRIHGTTQPSSIGKHVSAGCIRMLNKDVVDLYERVKPGSKVIVHQG